jgi:methyl-accepting chemotaxis protein
MVLPRGYFKGLPLRTKIFLTPLLSIVLFIAYLGFTLLASSANTQRLERVRDVTFPTLTLANANVGLAEKIAETFNSAVATGESDMVDAADGIAAKLRDNLREFGRLDASQTDAATAALQRFDSYYGKARDLTAAMVAKRLDMGQAGPRLVEMRNELGDLNKQLIALRDNTHARFVEMVEASAATAKQMLAWGMAGALAAAVAGLLAWFMASIIVRSVQSVLRSMRDMASGNGDLTQRIHPEAADEIGQLVGCFNDFVGKLNADIGGVVDALKALEAPICTMTDIVAKTETSVAEERSVIADVTVGVGRILQGIELVAGNASRASAAAAEADAFARTSHQNIQSTVQTINDLAHSVQQAFGELGQLRGDADQIGTVVNTIKGIADQTNLLALNAAIEAARAGEHGRGFAVVADEVRTLSGQTQEATVKVTQIVAKLEATMTTLSTIVESSRNKAVSSVEEIAGSGRSVEEIAGKVTLMHAMNDEIAKATEQQRQSAETIKGRIGDLGEVSNLTASQSGSLADASHRIRDLADGLRAIAGHFRI